MPKCDEEEKNRENREKRELVSSQCVKVFLLKDAIITTSVTTVISTSITILVFEFCHNLIFLVLSHFEFLSLVTI